MEETVGWNGFVVTEYQFDKNTHTDSHFLQEYLSAMERPEKERTLIADVARLRKGLGNYVRNPILTYA